MAGLRADRTLAGLCLLVAAIGFWDVLHYPPGSSFDYGSNAPYADGLVPGLHLPQGSAYNLSTANGSYYTPPGYYLVAGLADWLARGVGIHHANTVHRAGMAVNVVFLIGTVILVALIARELWPGRDRIALGAAAFVGLLPTSIQMGTMFHPEMMSLFFSALALLFCVRTFRDRRYAWGVGVALGIDQLVRAYALWTVAVVAIALLAGRRWRDLAIVLVIAAAIPMPWYVHETVKYGSPLFPRPVVAGAKDHATKKVIPLYRRRPARFYFDPGLPELFTHPYLPANGQLFIPTTYDGLWGDFEGHWAWNGATRNGVVPPPSTSARRKMLTQAIVGVLPTLLAVAGWLLFLVRSRRTPVQLALSLLPLAGLVGYLYFTVSNPTTGVLKPSYMLTATTGWALGFGYMLDRFRGKAFFAVAGLLALCALAELPFLIY